MLARSLISNTEIAMQLRTIVGCYEIEEILGENKNIPFKLVIPANFSWETLHEAIANIATGAKEWEIFVKKQAEEKAAAEPVAPEVVA